MGCNKTGAGPTPNPTIGVPTPTMEPMAVIVNGEGITIAEYQAELNRYMIATKDTGITTAGGIEPRLLIIDELINQTLLAQSAYQSGFQISDNELDERINLLTVEMGGTQALTSWQEHYGYTDNSLRGSLQRSIAAAWMRDQLIASVPLQTEQLHARQILLADEQTALSVKSQLDNGADFTDLAYQFDTITGGDLGWFPRGYLNTPEVENATFTTDIGKYTEPIESAIGWHILLVVEKDMNHELSPDAMLSQQHQVLSDWLADRRSASSIDIQI
ncbi:MAG: peptidylprolyl isomerase [Anaerolineaceae bacterium]|nr:peptidylprolyl isomerase [Anaerolineaceae bacterium]